MTPEHKKSGAPALLFRAVPFMMAITLAGKVMGLLRERIQGGRLGVDTPQGIAFLQAASLPRDFLDILFVSVFSASFIPVFNAYLETKDKKAAFDLAAVFISAMLALTTAVTVLCVLFAEPLFTLFLSGEALPEGAAELGVTLLRVMLPLIVLSGLAYSLTGVLQSLGEFNLPAAMSVVSNGIILAYYFFFFDRFGVYGLCAAYLLGWAGQAAIQLPFLVKQKFRFRFKLNFRDPGLRQIAALALPVMAASWVGPVNLMVGRKAAALYGVAYDLSGLNYANTLYTIISGVFVLSVANVVFPRLSKQFADGDNAGFSETLRETLSGLLYFLLPMTAGLMTMSQPLVKLVFEYGLFNETAVAYTARALFWFSPGIIGYGVQIILSRACYALHDGKTPVVSAAAAMAVNALLSFALAPRYQAAGVAAASSVSISVSAVILFVSLAKKGYVPISRAAVIRLLKLALATAVMLAAVLPLRLGMESALTDSMPVRIITAGIPAAVGGAVYVGLCAVVKIPLPWRKNKAL